MEKIINNILIANRDVFESKEHHFYTSLANTLSCGDNEDGLKMFKAIIATMAFTKFDDTAISAIQLYQTGELLLKRFSEVLKAREKLAGKIVLVTTSKKSPLTIDNIKNIATMCDMTYIGCTSKTTDESVNEIVKKNDDKPALIRICKNILYAPDQEVIFFIIGGQIIGNANESKHFTFILNRYPRFKSIMDDEDLAVKILTLGFLKESLDAAIAAEEKIVSENLLEFTKKRTIPMLENKLKEARDAAESARIRYEALYADFVRAGEELTMVGDLNKLAADKIEKFFQYINRLKTMGIVSHIRTVGVPTPTQYVVDIMFKPLPIRYIDSAALKKCYMNILLSIPEDARNLRKKHIEKIIAGEEFLIATPATIRMTFDSKISHMFEEPVGNPDFENPHFRYSNRQGCLGTFATSLSEAAVEKDYMKYLALLVQYVQTITPNDGAGDSGIRRLAICDSEGNIVLTEANEEPAEKIYKDAYFR